MILLYWSHFDEVTKKHNWTKKYSYTSIENIDVLIDSNGWNYFTVAFEDVIDDTF